MATTLHEVSQYLDAASVRYRHHDDRTLVLMYEMEQYRNSDGEPALLIAITLEEDGQYVKIFAPSAFNAAESDHLDVFLRTCMTVQWKTKLVQFEYDPSDGEVRPIVEFALEDSALTQTQLMRCVSGLVGLLDHFAPTLYKALDEGVVEMPDDSVEEETTIESLAEFLAGFPPDILAEALGRADARMRSRENSGDSGQHPENDVDDDDPDDDGPFGDGSDDATPPGPPPLPPL